MEKGPKPGDLTWIIPARINTAGKEILFDSNNLKVLPFSLNFISVKSSVQNSEHSQVPLTWANRDLFFCRVFSGNVWAPLTAKRGQRADAAQNRNVI